MNGDILKDNIGTKLLFDIWIISGEVDSDSQRVKAYEYLRSFFGVEATNAAFFVPGMQKVQNVLVIE